MNQEKKFDCIEFKRELQERTLKNNGAKNLRGYADYINIIAQKSPLQKAKENAAKGIHFA
jgi:hypothetical protein